MKANVYFGRYGASFFCSLCAANLREKDGVLIHPAERRVFFVSRPICCAFTGMKFKHPFRPIDLEQAKG